MSLLLDTHTLLWARLEPSRLPPSHQELIQATDQPKYLSTISLWEISLKFALGKLSLGGHTPDEFLASALALGFQILAPTPEQLTSFYRLPPVVGHRDPFDRMLIWQAMQEQLTLLSSDRQLPNYRLHGLKLA